MCSRKCQCKPFRKLDVFCERPFQDCVSDWMGIFFALALRQKQVVVRSDIPPKKPHVLNTEYLDYSSVFDLQQLMISR